jgi:hypothetical protein
MKWDKGLFYATEVLHDHRPNSTHQWLGSDTKQYYDKNKAEANARGYDENSITYILNDYGFRSKNFSNLEEDAGKFKILVSGCSHTFGIGNRLEETWPVKFAEMIPNSVLYNVALGGQSMDYSVRSIYRTIDVFKPDLVAMMWPPVGRFEFPLTYNPRNHYLPADPNYPQLLVDETYQTYTSNKNIVFLNEIVNARNIPLIVMSNEEACCQHYIDDHNARDQHWGLKIQLNIANAFFERYLQLPPKSV